MAKFSPPWASVGGVTRSPTVDEHNDGFPCGDLDLELWNRLVQGIHAELAAIQDAGGITGTEGDDTTVLQAIENLISAATGGGDTSQFVLFSQMQANNPVYPNVTTNNGVINVTDNGDGTIRLPASATIVHRGIRPFTTAQTDFPTTANKTYHLRCAISGATATYSLKDLADLAYNPTVAAETNSAFDTTYDDVLIARIVTNSSNVPTITNLTNKAKLISSVGSVGSMISPSTNDARALFNTTLNWGRTPTHRSFAVTQMTFNDAIAAQTRDHDVQLWTPSTYPSGALETIPATRYASSFEYQMDYSTAIALHLNYEA